MALRQISAYRGGSLLRTGLWSNVLRQRLLSLVVGSMIRRIDGLRWARMSAEGPRLPISRPRGAKAAGLRYERALARALPTWKHGQWWEFEDRRGHGWCQTDLMTRAQIADPLHGGDEVVILEAKYTYTREAWEQIEGLYAPVLTMATGRSVVGIQVCRALTPLVEECEVTGELGEAMRLGRSHRVVLHWLGMGLVPWGPPVAFGHPSAISSRASAA